MAVGLLLTALVIGAAKKAKQAPSSDCIVTVTLADGSTEPRDCYIMEANSKDLQPGTKARFESCTAWRLDHPAYAEMRRYLKEEERWKEWENIEMKWISHHNPDLVILDDSGKEKERIDLQGLTADKLEKFLESKGCKKR